MTFIGEWSQAYCCRLPPRPRPPPGRALWRAGAGVCGRGWWWWFGSAPQGWCSAAVSACVGPLLSRWMLATGTRTRNNVPLKYVYKYLWEHFSEINEEICCTSAFYTHINIYIWPYEYHFIFTQFRFILNSIFILLHFLDQIFCPV